MKGISAKSCQSCEKSIRKKQNSLQCSSCKHSFHQKCTAVTPSQFFDVFKGNKGQKYTCENCIVSSRTNIGIPEIISQSDEKYHSVSELNEKLKSKNNADLFVLHYNIVSLVPYVDSISSMISKLHVKPDAICISESRLLDKKIEWQKPLVQIPGYVLKYDNSKTSAGGVVIYVNSLITNFKVMNELKLDVADCESIFLEHGLLEETGHATPNLCKIKCGPTFELPNLVLNLRIFRQTFFSRSLEFCLVLREKVIFFLRTTPAALGRVLSDQVVFSPKTASCFE